VPKKHVPLEYFDHDQRIAFDVEEASQHGISFALILTYWRAMNPSKEMEGFKVLSPADMSKVLPGSEQAIARHIKQMVTAGLLFEPAQQRKQRKLYILAT
jgi:hypothetical protein